MSTLNKYTLFGGALDPLVEDSMEKNVCVECVILLVTIGKLQDINFLRIGHAWSWMTTDRYCFYDSFNIMFPILEYREWKLAIINHIYDFLHGK